MSKAHTGYKASFPSKVNVPGTPADLGKDAVQRSNRWAPGPELDTAWLIRATLRDAAAAAKDRPRRR